MKKRFIALLLIVTLLCVCLAACVPNNPDGNGDNTTQKPDNGSNQGNGTQKPDNGVDHSEDISKDDFKPDGFDFPDDSQVAGETDPAILAISQNRLKNADLNFVFAIGRNTDSLKCTTAKQYGAANVATEHKPNIGTAGEFTVVPGAFQFEVDYSYNFLSSEQEIADRMGRNAREIADFAVENITVMNKAVEYWDRQYVIRYDEESDTVCTLMHESYTDTDRYIAIQISNDENGKEKIDMWSYSNQKNAERVYGFTEHLTYIAKEYYFLAVNQWGYYNDEYYATYNLSTAYLADDGYWRGIRCHFNKDNAFLTKEGTYDYANGLLYFNFMFETDRGMYGFSEMLVPYRNGHETGSDVLADKNDEFRVAQSSLSVSGVDIDFRSKMMYVDFSSLTGWSELKVSVDTERELQQTGSEYSIIDYKDVLTLENGKKLSGRCLWLPDGTIVYFNGYDNHGPVYLDANGRRISQSDKIDLDDSLEFTGYAHIKSDGTITDAGMRIGFGEGAFDEKMDLLQKFMDSVGLGFVDEISETVFDDMASVQRKHTEYTADLYRTLYGCAFTPNNIAIVELAIAETLDSFEAGIPAAFEKYEVIPFYMQPSKQ